MIPVAHMPASSFIQFRGATKQYRRGPSVVSALRACHLTIEDGAFVGVVGPSGSGKSTLLHLLAALTPPSAGTLTVGDWTLPASSSDERTRYRREMVGLVFQQFHLVPTMTAHENVALPLLLAGVPPAERRDRAANWLRRVGLADRMTHRPSALSGGEQQRVATARALIGNPPLLLADEPTGNLDAETGGRVVDLLSQAHADGRTVVVATHHYDEIAAVTDRVVHLRDGAIVETTEPPG